MKILLFFCILFLQVDAQKAEISCGSNGNTDTLCSPKTNDTWTNGTWYPITWNPRYPSYVSAETLNIYVYFIKDYQRIQIKQWSDIDPAQGTFAVLVDDTWRIGSTRSTFECLVYILPAKVQPLKEINNALSEYPTPVHINVAQVALPLTTATIATAAPTSSTMTISSTLSIPLPTFSTSNEMKKDQDTLQPWVISAVSLAILAAIGTCISLCWIVRKRRLVYQENQPSVNESREENFFENNASSMTMVNPVVCRKTLKSEASSLHFQSTVSLCKEPLLTSTDALLIADTFRQKMRCPEWYQQEEERRRQKGKELLKKELEAEGTLVKKVGKSLLNDSNTHPS